MNVKHRYSLDTCFSRAINFSFFVLKRSYCRPSLFNAQVNFLSIYERKTNRTSYINFNDQRTFTLQNWLAFETLELPLFSEHGSSLFSQTSQDPSSSTNYAQCQVNFSIYRKNTPKNNLHHPKNKKDNNINTMAIMKGKFRESFA